MTKSKMLQRLYEALDCVFEGQDIENLDYGLIHELLYHTEKVMRQLKE